ncbi:MAG: glycosyltransferase family 4 protein [Gammaproteobacteria bacterium]|nr:glycosyltransferase family 4 protein [Gammaproteobacteria bacterium]
MVEHPDKLNNLDKNSRAEESCLFLLDNLGIGGSERKTIAAANILARRGYSIYLAFLNLSYDIHDTLEPSISTLDLQRVGKLDVSAVYQLRQYLKDNRISTIWSVNLYPMIYAFLATRIMAAPVRVIGSSNVSVFRNYYENTKMLIYSPIIRWVDDFVFGSERQMTDWRKRYFIGNATYSVIHNGVDLSRFSPSINSSQRSRERTQLNISENEIVFGKVAQFRAEKAHSDLLYACKIQIDNSNKIKLLLVGDGPTLNIVRMQAKSLGIEDSVIFAGLMEDVRPALCAMDVFVLTSVAVETFSNAALEAMAMGLPVVLSNIGGAAEMVESDYNGYLFPPGDVATLSERLKQISDKEVIKRLGKASRQMVESHFSADRMADRYEALIWAKNEK